MKSIKFIYSILLVSLMGWSSCGNQNEPDSDEDDFDRSAMLTNYADNLIIPRFEKLANSMDSLHLLVVEFTQSPATAQLLAVRNQLKSTRLLYQAVTSFDFGPSKDNTLRFILNTYPINTSTIENNIISGAYDLNTIENMTANGFPAMEYLLFGNQNTDQEILEMYSVSPDFENRKQYLLNVSNQSKTVIQLVKNEWVNGYALVFKNATGTATGSSVSQLVNAIVLDFERYIRDGKIGIPLGIRSLGVAKPETVEAYFDDYSLELFEESILKYQNSFNGNSEFGMEGLGLDDYLQNEGGADIANSINSSLESILAKSNQISNPLSSEVVSNKAPIEQVYAELQKTIVLLKVEMPSALSILINYTDTDGD